MLNTTLTMDEFVILGASDNPMRPSYLADKLLRKHGYKTFPVHGETIKTPVYATDTDENERTVAIFLKPIQQKKYYDFVLSLKPKRIIFNPGTENQELESLARKNNIKVLSGCTIAMVINSML